MQKVYALTGAALAAFLLASFGLTKTLGLTGPKARLFLVLLTVIGIAAAALFVWFQKRLRKSSTPAAPGAAPVAEGAADVEVLVREAAARLAASPLAPGAAPSNLPVVFVLGPEGGAKTNVILQSGMEAELLAGQVHQDNAVLPTRTGNVWFARNSLFVEVAGRLVGDSPTWQKLLGKLRPGKLRSIAKGGNAPRAAVVCVPCDLFAQPNASETLVNTARTLQARLLEVSQAYGIHLPVYALFTKADRISFFTEYVGPLTNEEAAQVLGATLPLANFRGAGVYAEQQAQRVGAAFDGLANSLADRRLLVLPREDDAAKLPGSYEFPREFRKLRPALVQFLVDLCRPSQLQVSPFLRGFYFSGVRPVLVSDRPSAPPVARSATAQPGFAGATGVFSAAALQATAMPAAAAAPAPTGRRMPQWVFLSRLFSEVIPKDDVALGASAASIQTSTARRVLLGVAAALCLLVATAFTISFFNNRALREEALTAAQGAVSAPAENTVASVDSLRRLEALRQSLARLTTYKREGEPFSLRWGLSTVDDLEPHVRKLYFRKFRDVMFGQTQGGILAFLQSVPAAPGPADDYRYAYDNLRSYLITTNEYKRSTKEYLAPVLLKRWSDKKGVDGERVDLARKQFEFYADELRYENMYSTGNDGDAIARTRRYLALFGGTERIYQQMLAEAGRQNPSLVFNQKYPGSAQVVVNTYEVPGAFSKGGWNFMQAALKEVGKYSAGERWVLGQESAVKADPAQVGQALGDRYTKDFMDRWRAYTKAGRVVGYASLQDAAGKLNILAGPTSPLLQMFWLASSNTGVDSPKVKEAMQPVHAVVPPSDDTRLVQPTNNAYVTGLMQLQASIDTAAKMNPPDPATAGTTLSNAAQARMAARQIGLTFRVDPEMHVEASVAKLLEDPITSAEGLVRDLGPAQLNGKGKALCNQFSALFSKFPFNSTAQPEVSLQELNGLLRPQTGAFWQFYEAELKTALTKIGNTYTANPAAGVPLNPGFVRFFNSMAAFSDALYAGGATEPRLSYSLKAMSSDVVQAIDVRFDGQSASLSAGGAGQKFSWPGTAAQEAKVSAKFVGGGPALDYQSFQGLWAAFRLFATADSFVPTGGTYQLEWQPTSGKSDKPQKVNDKPVIYRLQLDMGGSPAVFDKASLASLRCVAQVAK